MENAELYSLSLLDALPIWSLAERIERLVLIGASPGIAEASERAARSAADDRLADEIGATPDIATVARRWATSTPVLDRKSTRLNSSHANISSAVLCLNKKI